MFKFKAPKMPKLPTLPTQAAPEAPSPMKVEIRDRPKPKPKATVALDGTPLKVSEDTNTDRSMDVGPLESGLPPLKPKKKLKVPPYPG